MASIHEKNKLIFKHRSLLLGRLLNYSIFVSRLVEWTPLMVLICCLSFCACCLSTSWTVMRGGGWLSIAHCNGNFVYIFLFWELRGLSPNFYIHVSVSDLYIPRIGPHISSSRKGRLIVGIYNSLTDTWMWKLGVRPRYSFSGNIFSQFRHFVFAVRDGVLCREMGGYTVSREMSGYVGISYECLSRGDGWPSLKMIE